VKHQYFGDVNDYRKYGLLRALETETAFRVGVWWMLTPDDGRSDGKFTRYLSQPTVWQRFDRELYDILAEVVPLSRSVGSAKTHGILHNAVLVEEFVPDSITERRESFARAKRALSTADLIFLDPDNGLDVPSRPSGRTGSNKYVLRAELADLYSAGHSLLIYQHFPREERASFIRRLGATLRSGIGAPTVHCFRTSNVGFFLVPQASHEAALCHASDRVAERWASQITLIRDCQI
jgi:hypothetical protein